MKLVYLFPSAEVGVTLFVGSKQSDLFCAQDITLVMTPKSWECTMFVYQLCGSGRPV